MKWVTRENAAVDRIACPWLIRRFIDPDAEFIYVTKDEVLAVAEREGANSYDAPGAKYTHRGGKCSFEALVEDFDLAGDAALVRLAEIVHAADVSDDPSPAPRGRDSLPSRAASESCTGRRIIGRSNLSRRCMTRSMHGVSTRRDDRENPAVTGRLSLGTCGTHGVRGRCCAGRGRAGVAHSAPHFRNQAGRHRTGTKRQTYRSADRAVSPLQSEGRGFETLSAH